MHDKLTIALSGLLLISTCWLSEAVAQGQQAISGTITSSDGEGQLPGVNVLIKGSTIGTISDVDGNYRITVPSDDATLVFSFVGYESKEVAVGNSTTIDVSLSPDVSTLDEIVVVGYGSQKRSDLTGSVASVSGKDMEKMPVPTFDLALQGRAPGLQITNTSAEPGGGTSIRIRGSNSVLGSNEPLIVLDGYPLPPGGDAGNAGDTGGGRGQGSNLLSFINPNEIASVEILKDASATAIYGSRGANGVIIVTTKKGKPGNAQINLTSEVGVSAIPDFPALMTGPQFAAFRNEDAIRNGNPPPFDGDELPLPQDAPTTNWLDLILRTGVRQRYQLDISGGSENTRYYISGNYLKNEGIVKETDFNRGNIRINLDSKLNDRLSLSSSLNYARTFNNRSQEGTGLIINSGAIFSAYKANPTALGNQVLDDPLTSYFVNPLVQLQDKTDETNDETSIISLQATYKLLEGLDFNFRAGTTNKNNRREIYWPRTTGYGRLNNGAAIYNSYQYNDYLVENFLTYNKEFGNHKVNVAGGYSWQDNTERQVNNSLIEFPTDNLGTNAIGLGLTPSIPTSSKIKRVLSSYYLRTNYIFNNKYFITFSGRADGSSVFAEGNKWGFFPSGALGWALSEESFMDMAALSNLKIRASYGLTGTQSIPPQGSLTLLGVANAAINDVLVSGLAPIKLGNPDLEWEKTTQLDIGLDLGLFEDRLYATFDYYNKQTNDLLQNLPLPTSAGLGSIIANTGTIENKGIELLLGGYLIDNEGLSWNTSLNYSRNRATVISLGEEEADIFGPAPAANIVNEASNIMRVGEPFGSFYGVKVIGLIQASDVDSEGNITIPIRSGDNNPGSWKYEDVNGDGVISEADRIIIGDPNPDFIFGWNNDVTYKNFTLSVFIQGVVGNDVMNIDRLFLASGRTDNNSFAEWFEKRWTPENPHNDIRYPGSNVQDNLKPNSAIVEDGSYVRLKNVTLGYNIPAQAVSFLRSVNVYFTATNLLTFTNYSGFDPEVSIFGGNNIATGVDFGSYPRSRMYTVGVQLGF